jgi:catechol 2,3-dioxygenase-like lactoylglutathione lyase family enzyme
MIDRVFHVVASTSDQVASLKFYEDTLGMTIVHGPFVAREGMSEAFAIPDEPNTQDLGTFYRWGTDENATVLDTNLWMRPRCIGTAYEGVNHTGITRLSAKVRGISDLHASLTDAGVKFVSKPTLLPLGGGDVNTCCIYNPDGAVFQLIEPKDGGADSPGYERIFAVCISVTDLDRSLDFYVNVLGLNLVGAPFDVEGDEVGHAFPLTEAGPASLRGAWLRPGSAEDNTLIELVQWKQPATFGEPVETVYNVGFPRVAFYVEDIQSVYQELRPEVNFFSPPVITDLSGAKAGYNCFRDPDGTILQLYEDIKD